MIVPDAIVRYVSAGPASQANVACNRVLGAGGKPLVIIIANDVAIVDFTDAFKSAIETARANGEVEKAEIWKKLVLQILAAYDGLGQLPT
jgi:ABC-type branched-subunit amino acid transport system substrate-binding protein